MNNSWILDVLSDLSNFADQNDLPQLSLQLEQAKRVAQVEIDVMDAGLRDEGIRHAGANRTLVGELAECRDS